MNSLPSLAERSKEKPEEVKEVEMKSPPQMAWV
jgi:hypothetical protein